MSNRGTDFARTRSFGSSAKKAIAYVLGDHHNAETGRLDPSIATIAREADLSVRAVQTNLREMERAGALMVLRTPGRRCCTYILNWDWRGVDGRAAPVRRRPNPAYDCTNPAANPAPDSPKPEREDSTGRKEESAAPQAAPPAPPPPPSMENLAGKEAKRPRRTPLPDDWAPSPEERQLARDAGYDPDEIVEETCRPSRLR
jgi:hypothetical protein